MKIKSKLQKEDLVMIISGKEKGKSGKILNLNNITAQVTVEGCNIQKKTVKKTQENQSGGTIEREASIHISNVMYLDGNKPTRLGYKIEKQDKKKKVRFSKKSGKVL